MPDFNIVKKTKFNSSFRVDSVIGKFDLPQKNEVEEVFVGNIDLPETWDIGLIVGNSGTGKTTVANELFKKNIVGNIHYGNKPIVDEMPQNKTVDEIVKTFNSVGFSSPVSWLKPYGVLSNGERMRVDLAFSMLNENKLFVFDEFTSVVDRNVAKIGSFAIQKSIRKNKQKQFIAISPHFDIIDWLLPDWIFYTNDMTFVNLQEQKKNRPKLNFKIYETKEKSKYWKMFSKYHYLSHTHNNAARVFILTVDDVICGFSSAMAFPHPYKKNFWREHRTVIMPDYQGIGLGHRLSNSIGEILKLNGKGFISTTSNPSLIYSRLKDERWIATRKGRIKKPISKNNVQGESSCNRITMSFQYRDKL